MLSNLTREYSGFIKFLSVFSRIKYLMSCRNGSKSSSAVMANRLRAPWWESHRDVALFPKQGNPLITVLSALFDG